MDSDAFNHIAELVHRQAGIVLTSNKTYLVQSRLQPLLRYKNYPDVSHVVDALKRGDPGLETAVVDALTTNDTLFFRDTAFWNSLKTYALPYLMKRRTNRRQLKVWCNGVSTGQEAYSLSMLLDEVGPGLEGWSLSIFGTDVSPSSLQQAEAGVYSHFEAQRGLTARQLITHFDKSGENWRVKEDVRQQVSFHWLNLIEQSYSVGRFDIIFCRNVLYYFDQPTKTAVLNRLAEHLTKDGLLVLGTTETVVGVSRAFKPVRSLPGLFVPAETDINVDAEMAIPSGGVQSGGVQAGGPGPGQP